MTNFDPQLTTALAVFMSLFAAFLWGTWFIVLKHLDDYPVDAFYMSLFAFSLLLVWGIAYAIDGPALFSNLGRMAAAEPLRIWVVLGCGVLYVIGIRLTLTAMQMIGLTLTQPIYASANVLAGTLVAALVGGVPEGLSLPRLVAYCESLYVGYRYYDTADVEVLFPFGHGLSYTRFEYSSLALSQAGDTVTVTFKVRNSGPVAGQEVVQLYVRDPEASFFRPQKELKGFAKLALQPGEEHEVTLPLGPRAFAFYDPASRAWVVEAGDFEILVGASSRDIRLKAVLHLAEGRGSAAPQDRQRLAAYFQPSSRRRFSPADLEALLGHPLPVNPGPQKGSYDLNTPLAEMSGSLVGRQLFKIVKKQMAELIKGQEDTPTGMLMSSMAGEMPLRSMLMFPGALDRPKLEALLLMINGHFFQGLGAFLRAGSGKKK